MNVKFKATIKSAQAYQAKNLKNSNFELKNVVTNLLKITNLQGQRRRKLPGKCFSDRQLSL